MTHPKKMSQRKSEDKEPISYSIPTIFKDTKYNIRNEITKRQYKKIIPTPARLNTGQIPKKEYDKVSYRVRSFYVC